MSERTVCERCGAPLDPNDAACARCLLELARAAPPSSASTSSTSSVSRARRRASPTVEEVARRFPELEIARMIGEGGMGAVYEARQPRIDRRVALKVLALDPSDDPTFAERFRREALVLAKLDHPNVVKLYDFGERDGLYFLVLEYVDGTNLRTLMKQGLVTPKQALALVPEVCAGLQYAHDEGIVHRDVKPENVLVDAKGRVKLADFGLAKIVDADPREFALTDVGQGLGTPHYMAPEQLRGAADVDHRADIYSLGVVLYELLTGELPRGNFELPSRRVEVDVRLDEIVLKSLERAPERRYQHAVEVRTDVERVGERQARHEERRARHERGDTRGARHRERVRGVYPSKPWHFFLFFLAMWPIAGFAFNGGGAWLVATLALISAAFWSMIEREVKANAELDAALQKEERGVIASRHLTALVALVVAFVALYFGEVSAFELLDRDYRPGPSDPAMMKEAVTELLPALRERTGLELDLGEGALGERFVSALDREAPLHEPWLLVVAAALCLLTAVLLAARWVDLLAWRGWRIPFRATAALLGTLALVQGLGILIRLTESRGGGLAPVLTRNESPALVPSVGVGVSATADRVRTLLVEHDYSVTAEGSWSYLEHGEPRELRVLFADPTTALTRWRLRWSGPRREQPHAVFAMSGPSESESCSVRCDLGDARASQNRKIGYRLWAEGLWD